MKRHSYTLLSIIIALLTVWSVEIFVGWQKIANTMGTLSPEDWAVLLPLSFITYYLRSIRTQISINIDAPNRLSLLAITAQHNLLNMLMPMRLGEASFPLLLKRKFKTPIVKSTGFLLLYRSLDFYILCCAALLVICAIKQPSWVGPLLGCLILTLVALPKILSYVAQLMTKPSAKLFGQLAQIYGEVAGQPALFFKLVLLTLMTWAVKLFLFAYFCSLFSTISFHSLLFSVIVADFSAVLPVHGVGGSGTYEGAFVLAGNALGYDPKSFLQLAVQLHLFYIAMALTFSVLLTCISKLHLKVTKTEVSS